MVVAEEPVEASSDEGGAPSLALDSGRAYRQVQMMSKHRGPKTVMRYDHGRENPEQNGVNFLGYVEA